MTLTLKTAMAGVDIGKNSFHVVGLDQCGATVLRQKAVARPSGRTICRHAAVPDRHGSCVGAHHLKSVARLGQGVGLSVASDAQ